MIHMCRKMTGHSLLLDNQISASIIHDMSHVNALVTFGSHNRQKESTISAELKASLDKSPNAGRV